MIWLWVSFFFSMQGHVKTKQRPDKPKSKAARGIRIAPKDKGLAKKKAMQKKLTSRNMVHTETLMAARAGATGKLTIMKKAADKALEKARVNMEKKQ